MEQDTTGHLMSKITASYSDQNRSDESPFRVLALEGGGLRGIYQAAYLRHVLSALGSSAREDIATDPGRAFDLIVGTSTGGLIACALGAGIDLGSVITLYRKHGAGIFPWQALRSTLGVGDVVRGLAWGAVRGAGTLEKQLLETFGSRTLGAIYAERGIAVAIPTVAMSRYQGVVFKTPHLSRLSSRDNSRLLSDVCLATTAAPVLRSMACIPEGRDAHGVYIDGGLWANNPSLLGLVEAMDIVADRQTPERPIHLFTLGTSAPAAGEVLGGARRTRGILGWKLGIKILDASAGAQSGGYDYVASTLARLRGANNLVVRLPVGPRSVPAQKLAARMDDARKKAIDALTEQATSDVMLAWSRRGSCPALDAFFREFERSTTPNTP